MDNARNEQMKRILRNKREKSGQEFLELLNQHLDFDRWGFKVSYQNFQRSSPYVVFDSEWCRVSFDLEKEQYSANDNVIVEYGRLYAPNEEAIMLWKGGRYHCWHQVFEVVAFLDGTSPAKTVRMMYEEYEFPKVIDEFMKSEIGRKYLKEYPPKFKLCMHNVLWKYYGQRLFEVFDLRQPKLWEEYESFMKEVYKIRSLSGEPPWDKIC